MESIDFNTGSLPRPSSTNSYLLITVAIVNVECVHGLHDGHHGLKGVAVDDDDELQRLLQGITILMDNSVEQKEAERL